MLPWLIQSEAIETKSDVGGQLLEMKARRLL